MSLGDKPFADITYVDMRDHKDRLKSLPKNHNKLKQTALTLVGLALVASIYFKTEAEILYKSFLFMAMLRFLLVVVVLLNGLAGRIFLEDRIEEERRKLDALPMEIEQLQEVSEVTNEDRESLSLQLEQLISARSASVAQVGQFVPQIEAARTELEAAENELDNVESGMPIYERLNPYNGNEAHRLARENRRQHQETLNAILEQQEAVQEESFSNAAGKAQSLVTVDFGSFNERFEGAIMSMINAIILFILQTIMLPIFFIIMLSKLMKAVWGIGLKDFVRKSREELQSDSLL